MIAPLQTRLRPAWAPSGRRAALAALTALMALGTTAATANTLASTQAPASVPGPSSLATGFVDDQLFEYSADPVRALWLDRTQQLGARWVRIDVVWPAVAPYRLPRRFRASDPRDRNYHFATLDAAVRAATNHGENVVLLLGHAPLWAQGSGRPRDAFFGAWKPSARAFGAFVHAVALRYSGRFRDLLNPGQSLPRVTYFQAWNEPNLRTYIEPQWNRTRSGSFTPESPEIYRGLLNAAYSAVKSVHADDYVLSAGTAPYGDPPGVDRIAPEVFLRQLFCLTAGLRPKPCPHPAHLDALDHHPYALTPTNKARIPGDVSIPDLGKIGHIVHLAERDHTVLPAGNKPLWITEIDWGSNPPDPLNIPLALQARYLPLAFYELWQQGVSHVFWYLLRDPPKPQRSFTGGGVYFLDGTAKPSAAAFSFPFVAVPGNHGVITIWGKAPTPGTVTIERLLGSVWSPVAQLSTTPGGIFYTQRHLGSNLQLRARIGSTVSLVWATG